VMFRACCFSAARLPVLLRKHDGRQGEHGLRRSAGTKRASATRPRRAPAALGGCETVDTHQMAPHNWIPFEPDAPRGTASSGLIPFKMNSDKDDAGPRQDNSTHQRLLGARLDLSGLHIWPFRLARTD
jgi:hypothetical protein